MTEETGVRVMMLSESPELSSMLTLMLERSRDDEVTEWTDGSAALAECAVDPPDLIVFSWRGVWMWRGYCDAADFTVELRKVPGCADVPVLVMSAMCSVRWLLKLREAGVNGHIVSPGLLVEIIAARDAVLRGEKVGVP